MAVAGTPPPSRARRRRGLLVVATVVGLGVAGIALYAVVRPSAPGGSSGPSPSVPTEIDLLPSTGTRTACIVDTPGQPRPTLPLENGTLQANTYAVPSGTVGHVGMCYNATDGALWSYANWSDVGVGGGWFSYPQVAYGGNEYDGPATTYTNQSPGWVLPPTVATSVNESLWVTSEYDLHAPKAADVDGYDLSLDNFFSQGLPPRFEVGPSVEVEIFLAHNISYPYEWVHWTVPTLVNSTVAVEPWDVAYWCHGTDNGSNANISFDFSYDGQATRGLGQGTLGQNLSAMLAEVESLLPGASCWTGPVDGFSHFYLDEEDLGSGDGAVGGSSFNYNWTVSSYCLHTHVDAADSTGLACRSTRAEGTAARGGAIGPGNDTTPPTGCGSAPGWRSAVSDRGPPGGHVPAVAGPRGLPTLPSRPASRRAP